MPEAKTFYLKNPIKITQRHGDLLQEHLLSRIDFKPATDATSLDDINMLVAAARSLVDDAGDDIQPGDLEGLAVSEGFQEAVRPLYAFYPA